MTFKDPLMVARSNLATYLSADGVVWAAKTALPAGEAVDLCVDSTTGYWYAATKNGHFYESIDDGVTWVEKARITATKQIASITYALNRRVYAITYGEVQGTVYYWDTVTQPVAWTVAANLTPNEPTNWVLGVAAITSGPNIGCYVLNKVGHIWKTDVDLLGAWTSVYNFNSSGFNDLSNYQNVLYISRTQSLIYRYDGAITQLAFSPPNEGYGIRTERGQACGTLWHLFIDGRIWKSQDEGATAWVNMSDVGAFFDGTGLAAYSEGPCTGALNIAEIICKKFKDVRTHPQTGSVQGMIVEPWTYFHYTGGTGAQTVKASAGILGTVTVNKGLSGKTVTVTDGANTIAVIDASNPISIQYNATCATDIKTTNSDNALDITVTYR